MIVTNGVVVHLVVSAGDDEKRREFWDASWRIEHDGSLHIVDSTTSAIFESFNARAWHSVRMATPQEHAKSRFRVGAVEAGDLVLVDFVFEGPPGPIPTGFIDTMLPTGQGCGVGEWVEKADGTWAIRAHVYEGDVRRQT